MSLGQTVTTDLDARNTTLLDVNTALRSYAILYREHRDYPSALLSTLVA